MPAAPLPVDEVERLRALQRYGILDTETDPAFERLTQLAARLFDTPIALISLVDADRQWFKACYGVDTTETPRSVAFCAHAILCDDVLEVLDPQNDPRFADSTLVTGPPFIRYYAGAQLVSPTGHRLGTLCINDTRPRPPLSVLDRQTLKDLAACVMTEMELRLTRLEVDTALSATHKLEAAIEERFGDMAHDFKTPLNAILGYSELAGATQDPDTLSRYVTTIQEAGQHLLDLVTTTLDGIRAHAIGDEGTAHGTAADLATQARAAAAMSIPPDAAEALTIDIPAETWVAMAPVRLREVLMNYLSNAAKYAPGEPVTVRAWRDGGEVVCEVIDRGPGVPDAEKPHVFDKGFRLPDSGHSAEGHGMGLSVVRTMVRTAGGRCGVHDAPDGVGSVFWFRLPGAPA